MRIYRIEYNTEAGHRFEWHKTQDEARARVRELKKDKSLALAVPAFVQLDVPTDKVNLIKWLNENLDT